MRHNLTLLPHNQFRNALNTSKYHSKVNISATNTNKEYNNLNLRPAYAEKTGQSVCRGLFYGTSTYCDTYGRAMVLLVAGLSLWRPGLDPKPVHVEFMVDKEAFVQVRNQVFRFPPSLS
jgi:hypothetical protein